MALLSCVLNLLWDEVAAASRVKSVRFGAQLLWARSQHGSVVICTDAGILRRKRPPRNPASEGGRRLPDPHVKEAMSLRSPRRPHHARPLTVTASVAVAALATTGLVGCGRSSSSPSTSAAPASAPAASHAATAVGSFGTLTDVCGPGQRQGSDRARRHQTPRSTFRPSPIPATASSRDSSRSSSTPATPSSSGATRRAASTDARSCCTSATPSSSTRRQWSILQACQSDFMEVGGGTALDDATVKPRLACGLGDIPAYHVSPTRSPPACRWRSAVPRRPGGYVGRLSWRSPAQTPSFKQHTGVYATTWLDAAAGQTHPGRAW